MQLKPLLLAIPFLLIAGTSRAEIKSVNVPSANFRDAPSPDGAIMFSADKYYPVEIIKRHNGWARVKDFEGDEAWVAERLLADQETVVITRDRVNVREKGTTSGDVIFKAQRGEVFKVVKQDGKWLNIEDANGEKGWIRNDMTWGQEKAAEEKLAADDKKDDKGKKDGKKDDKAKAKSADSAKEPEAQANGDEPEKGEPKDEPAPKKKDADKTPTKK